MQDMMVPWPIPPWREASCINGQIFDSSSRRKCRDPFASLNQLPFPSQSRAWLRLLRSTFLQNGSPGQPTSQLSGIGIITKCGTCAISSWGQGVPEPQRWPMLAISPRPCCIKARVESEEKKSYLIKHILQLILR